MSSPVHTAKVMMRFTDWLALVILRGVGCGGGGTPLHIITEGLFTLSSHLWANKFKLATSLTLSRHELPTVCPITIYTSGASCNLHVLHLHGKTTLNSNPLVRPSTCIISSLSLDWTICKEWYYVIIRKIYTFCLNWWLNSMPTVVSTSVAATLGSAGFWKGWIPLQFSLVAHPKWRGNQIPRNCQMVQTICKLRNQIGASDGS